MRVCFVLGNASIGGFRTFTVNLGGQFRRDGHEVCALLCSSGSAEGGDVETLRSQMDVHTVCSLRPLFRGRFLGRIIREVHALAPDVILLNHSRWVQAALPYIDPNIKRFVVIHNVTPEEVRMPRSNAPWWDVAISVGPSVRDLLLEDFPARKVRLITVGVPKPPMPTRTEFDNVPLRLCYIGRLAQPQKNILLLPKIQALLSSRHVECVWEIIGEGPDGAELISRVRQAGLESRFVFHGQCGPQKVQSILSCQNVMVLPSFFELVPHVLQEAQMLGVVPVTSPAGSVVVTDRQDGRICRNDDAEDFAKAIAALYEDRHELRRLSVNGTQSVQRFEIGRIAHQYYRLFEEVDGWTDRPTRARRRRLGLYRLPKELMPSRLGSAWAMAKRVLRGKAPRTAGSLKRGVS
jgi:glycosyltransferase involved in cell wall biosynthesis